jgi:hypothetical protein
MKDICEEDGAYCDASIAPSFTQDKKFNLLGQKEVQEIFRENIAVEIKKLGV